MFKKVVTIASLFLINLGSISFIVDKPAEAYSIQIYSTSFNQHGGIVNTSVGKFYLGKSGDAIHEVSGYKRYGFWESNNSVVIIHIAEDVYRFYL